MKLMLGWPELTLIILILLLLLGPSRLPALAKSVGQTVKEFRKATESPETTEGAKTTAETPESELLLVNVAKKLGIETEGKTAKELADEIAKLSKK
jgi:sec-independent protein translocase protein TatA